MKSRRLAICLLCLTGFCQSGCLSSKFSERPFSLSALQPMDYRDEIEEGSDEWTEIASKEGRGNRPRELISDGWIDRWTKSPKAQAIANHMGIDFK